MNHIMFIFVSYLLGVLGGYYFHNPISLFPVFIFFFLLFGIFWDLSKPAVFDIQHLSLLLFVCLLFMSLGFSRIKERITQIDEPPPSSLTHHFIKNPAQLNSSITLLGRVIKPPEYFHQKTRLYITVESVSIKSSGIEKIILPWENFMTSEIAQLDWRNPSLECQFYDPVKVTAKLRLPADYQNQGCFSYSKYLRQQGIFLTGTIQDLSLYIPAKTIPYSYKILRWIYNLRRVASLYIENKVNKPDTYLLQSILLGDSQKIPGHIKNKFYEAGAGHLLSFGGLHLTILTMAIFLCFKILFYCLPDKWFELLTRFGRPSHLSLLLSIPFIIFYIPFTGGRMSTLRAGIMLIVYALSLILERNKKPWIPIILAGLIILISQPEALFQADFQLTFLACLGIISASGYLSTPQPLSSGSLWERFILVLKKYFFTSLAFSLAIFFILSPLALYYFHLIAPIGIITNLLVIPLIYSLLLIGSLGILFLPVCPALTNLLFAPCTRLTHLIIKLIRLLSGLPSAFFYLPTPSVTELLIIYTAIGFFFLCLQRFYPKPASSVKTACYLAISSIVLFLFLVSGFSSAQLVKIFNTFTTNNSDNYINPDNYNKMEVNFLDVGRGDSCLIITPGGKKILIDGGGSYNNDEFDFGRQVIAPYLWAKKIKHLDLVILSHPHPDHLNGLLFILKNFSIGQFWKSPEKTESLEYQNLEEIITQKKIPLRFMFKGKRLSLDNLLIEILAPDQDQFITDQTGTDYRELNNRSLVFKISYHQVSLLFTGDIEEETEMRLLKLDKALTSTILKVPHHGSRYSSSLPFISLVSPQAAIFSGRKYGPQLFPHPKTLARYKQLPLPCQIYRTDLDGAITITTDGHNFSVTTEARRKALAREESFSKGFPPVMAIPKSFSRRQDAAATGSTEVNPVDSDAYFLSPISRRNAGPTLCQLKKAFPDSSKSKPWLLEETTHFSFFYTAKDNYFGQELVSLAEESYLKITNELGLFPKERIEVCLADSKAMFRSLQPVPSEIGEQAIGLAYPGRHLILLLSPRSIPSQDVPLPQVFIHELTHIILGSSYQRNQKIFPHIPKWFEEGLCMYEAREWDWQHPVIMTRLCLTDNLIPFPEIEYNFPSNHDQLQAAYTQSLSLISFILNQYGPNVLPRITHSLIQGDNIDQALIKNIGLDLNKLEIKWKKHLRLIYTWVPILTSSLSLWFLISLFFLWIYYRKRKICLKKLAKLAKDEENEIEIEI